MMTEEQRETLKGMTSKELAELGRKCFHELTDICSILERRSVRIFVDNAPVKLGGEIRFEIITRQTL